MEATKPILLVDLLPIIDEKLVTLLKELSLSDWNKPTLAPKWTVKDIATHLLDGNIRTLSMLRDGYMGEVPPTINSYQDLVKYLNQLNADWVQAMKRVSPKILIELLESTGKEYCNYLKTLNLFDKAKFSVAWAGENESANWFHIAREYTEKWHHQQQIRLAVGQEQPLYEENLYLPYLETSMRALPHHYRKVVAVEGDLIKFTVKDIKNGVWYLLFQENKWHLGTDCQEIPTCEVEVQPEIAWRIFSKGITKEIAEQQSTIIGKRDLGIVFFDMLAVMA